MNKKIKDILFFAILFLIFDQAIKIFLTNNMIVNQSNILIKDLLSINLVYNTGAAFSIFNGSRLLLIIIGILALLGVIIFVIKGDNYTDVEVFIYALLIGGIAGNLLDRIIHGYVIDYLSFNFGNYYFPIFNFADICIVVSVVLIVIQTIKGDLWK